MTSVNYVKDDSGTFIPSSQRPDGTWRRPIRVKDGYVPQEEQPLYVSKGKQVSQYGSPYPIGMTESDVASYRSDSNTTTNSSQNQRTPNSSMYFDVGLYTPAPVATPIPGLNFVETPEPEKTSKKKKSKSKNKQNNADNISSTENNSGGKKSSANNHASSGGTTNAANSGVTTTDPAKRLRNLRKRLKDIEALEKKMESGELQNPEKEQLEKIKRKDDVLDEIDDLEKYIEKLNLS